MGITRRNCLSFAGELVDRLKASPPESVDACVNNPARRKVPEVLPIPAWVGGAMGLANRFCILDAVVNAVWQAIRWVMIVRHRRSCRKFEKTPGGLSLCRRWLTRPAPGAGTALLAVVVLTAFIGLLVQ